MLSVSTCKSVCACVCAICECVCMCVVGWDGGGGGGGGRDTSSTFDASSRKGTRNDGIQMVLEGSL